MSRFLEKEILEFLKFKEAKKYDDLKSNPYWSIFCVLFCIIDDYIVLVDKINHSQNGKWKDENIDQYQKRIHELLYSFLKNRSEIHITNRDLELIEICYFLRENIYRRSYRNISFKKKINKFKNFILVVSSFLFGIIFILIFFLCTS